MSGTGTGIETVAFLLKLRPGMAAEYRRRHDEIWPEMKDMLLASGILHYEIYLDAETNTLFAHMVRRTGPGFIDRHNNPVMLRWRSHMADVLVMDGERPVSRPLESMFRLKSDATPADGLPFPAPG
ncbi:MAG: L-rhamnose mutarotase [Hyphomicrobiaceae bacterium]|nr:L-rhamnose mutarotase [Hyphomicrobiaceae bacterium]